MDPQVVGLYRQTPLEDALPAQANGGPGEALQPAVVVASPEAQAASALIIAQSGDKGKAPSGRIRGACSVGSWMPKSEMAMGSSGR